ncbi:hypothetical protein X777_13151 [Ooceraea biroi]|uniref:Uncharacterized protein n=1 Tax=Ooceraea biroi TaxID=2015173 RepID=A0A026W0Z9_OOCBI|nr:hypothetical protein X777_13151 [Ooceraea biroi]
MPRNDGKLDSKKDREDIRWFENYEKLGKTGESLKNKDILNYIKDIERNCRLEVSSGDEDYAGTKRSSNCSVRFPDARFRSSKGVKSRITSRRNKSTGSSARKVKRSSGRNTMDARGYSRSSRNSRFRDNPDLAIPGNPKEKVNAPAESTLRYPRSSNKRGSYNCRGSSPRFYGWYSRKDRGTRPATTETTSLEIITNRPENVTLDRGIDSSRITEKKSARLRAFKSLHTKKMDQPIYAGIYSNVASSENAKLKNLPRFGEDRSKIARTSRFNHQGDVSGSIMNQRQNKFCLDRDAYPIDSLLQDSSRNEGHEGRYTSGYRYPVSKSARSTSWGQKSRSNRLATSRLPETSLRASRRQNEVGPPLEATGSITGAGSIDRSYWRESWRKNNTDQRRREPGVSGERELPCYRRPGFLRESGNLYKVTRTREGSSKLLFGCCCEDIERDEATADRSMHRRYPENVNRRDFRPREREVREVSSRSVQWNNHEEALDFDLSTGEHSRRNETAMYDDASMFDKVGVSFADDRANDRDDGAQLGDLDPHAPLPDDWTYQTRRFSEIARKCEESSCDLENNRRETRREIRRTLQRQIRQYPTGEESSFVIRTPRKLALRDPRGQRYGTAESTCECREPFHDPPAACLTGSCTCVEGNGNIQRNDNDDDDSSRGIPTEEVYCSYCCCSSSSSDNKNNQGAFREPSRCTCRGATRADVQRQPRDTNEQNQSITSNEAASQATGPTGRGWLTDPAGVRFGRPRYSRDRTNLEKILIYPPRGQAGPPLTLYKGSSNINCRVKGNADTGFRYSVTYVQKFVSPTWMPGASPKVETDEEYECSADHG